MSISWKRGVVSPLKQYAREDSPVYKFVDDSERILYDVSLENFNKCKETGEFPVSFEKAGPKENIFFEPAKTKVGIVTCGGLCPGLNNVIRSLVNELYYRYGISRVLGIKYGYEGLVSKYNHPVIELTAPDGKQYTSYRRNIPGIIERKSGCWKNG